MTVTGDSVATEGHPFVVAVIPQSQVSLALGIDEAALAPGASQVVTASMYDGASVIPTSLNTQSWPWRHELCHTIGRRWNLPRQSGRGQDVHWNVRKYIDLWRLPRPLNGKRRNRAKAT